MASNGINRIGASAQRAPASGTVPTNAISVAITRAPDRRKRSAGFSFTPDILVYRATAGAWTSGRRGDHDGKPAENTIANRGEPIANQMNGRSQEVLKAVTCSGARRFPMCVH